MWSPTQLAYLAGIIDGEGSIYIQSRKVDNTIVYFPRFQVANTDKKLMDWIKDNFGGLFYVKDRSKHNPNWRLQYEWFTGRKLLDSLLPVIHPYLVTKKEHAEIMIKFRQTFTKRITQKVPDSINELRSEYLNQLRILNKRGNNIPSPLLPVS